MNEIKNENGSVTVEATLSVTLFLLLMLFLSSLFFMTSAQEDIAHSIVQTSQSLSIEAYSISKLQTDMNTGAKAALTDLAVKVFSTANSDRHFYTDVRWFSTDRLMDNYIDEDTVQTKDPQLRNIDLREIIRTRFIGFFANGDEAAANEMLEKMGVIDGLAGLDFSESKVSGGVLYITVNYKMQYKIHIGDIGTVNASQTFCAKIWS